MKTEEEIRDVIEKCKEVWDFGMSTGPCPLHDDNTEGCCAECTTLNTLYWVLGIGNNSTDNAQDELIKNI